MFSTNNNMLNSLLNKKIEKPHFTDREKFILEKIEQGEQRFYENIRKELIDENIDICPY